jgi:Coenzyme PQQ synthesis protein D (PqqD)
MQEDFWWRDCRNLWRWPSNMRATRIRSVNIMSKTGRIYRKIEGFSEMEVPDGYIIYDTNRELTHFLNRTAALVLELCDGANDTGAIAAMMQHAFDLPTAPETDVEDCLASLHSQGLVAPCSRWTHLWSFFSRKGTAPISAGPPK